MHKPLAARMRPAVEEVSSMASSPARRTDPEAPSDRLSAGGPAIGRAPIGRWGDGLTTRLAAGARSSMLAFAGAMLSVAALAAPTTATATRGQDHGGHKHARAAGHRHGYRGKSAAKQTYVRESATLHLSSHQSGGALVERGIGHGTFTASVQITLTIKARVTGTFVAHMKGGTIVGRSSAKPHLSKSNRYASFKGTLRIVHGTGRYAHASGTAGFYGSIDRADYKLKVQVIGHVHL